MGIKELMDWLAANPLTFGLLTLAGQLWLNQRFKLADEKREAAKADAERERQERAEWRKKVEDRLESLDGRLDSQDELIDTILTAQCSQMRADIIHKCHRYLDDLGKASIEEKNALKAEHDEYSAVCSANGIVNNFVDLMVQRVMELPERDM